jgi:arylsulfatase A-like enzyme
MKASVGRVTSVLAEAVDFYPTLAALAGLSDPLSAGQHLNGTSLLPVFVNPDNGDVKSAVRCSSPL